MRKKAAVALLLLVVSAVLGATVLREPISLAATPFQNVIVGNTADNPVPVREQGMVAVSPVAVTSGGGAATDQADTDSTAVNPPATASALMVRFSRGGGGLTIFSYQGSEVLRVPNEAGPNDSDPGVVVHVPLTRAVTFDEVRCTIVGGAVTPASCTAFFAGGTP